MDNCKDNIEAISMLIDGELGEEQAASLRAHIASCDTCKKVYDAFSAISSSIGDELVEPPEQLAKGIMFKVGIMNERKKKPRFAYGRFTAIAACLALILFGANHFGLLNGDTILAGAAKQSVARDSAAPEENSSLQESISGGFMLEAPSLPDASFYYANDEAAPETDITSAAGEAEKPGSMMQFGLGAHPFDNGTGASEELSFITYLGEILAYADENDNHSTEENFAFFSQENGETAPVTIRIYEGEYEKPSEHASASNIFNFSKNEEVQPVVEFSNLTDLRMLSDLLTDAEETDKTFTNDPSYTIGVFDEDDKLMDDKILPMRLWIHDGHIYFEADAEGKLLRVTMKPDELLKMMDTLKEAQK